MDINMLWRKQRADLNGKRQRPKALRIPSAISEAGKSSLPIALSWARRSDVRTINEDAIAVSSTGFILLDVKEGNRKALRPWVAKVKNVLINIDETGSIYEYFVALGSLRHIDIKGGPNLNEFDAYIDMDRNLAFFSAPLCCDHGDCHTFRRFFTTQGH